MQETPVGGCPCQSASYAKGTDLAACRIGNEQPLPLPSPPCCGRGRGLNRRRQRTQFPLSPLVAGGEGRVRGRRLKYLPKDVAAPANRITTGFACSLSPGDTRMA